VSSCKSQALVDAPVEKIWELVGDPNRHPEWWPKVIEVNGEQFGEGSEYVQVTRSAMGKNETTDFLVERRQELREIKLRCQMSGTYAHWLMTEAQGGTFVDVEFGMDPKGLGLRLFDGAFGRIYFRRWMEQSVEGLKQAAAEGEPSRTTAP
jgi:uncharacterized protein YndB with AHSA1/START domain